MTLRNQHVKPEDFFCLFFFFGDHLNSTGKTVRISVRTFFFVLRSHHISDQTAAFSLPVLDFTEPEIRHIRAGPGPMFGPGAPEISYISASLKN